MAHTDPSLRTPCPIFVGRKAEIDAFTAWVEHEPGDDSVRRAALVTGSAGMGKSALLKKLASLCVSHSPNWFVQYAVLNGNESPNAFLERLLNDAHRMFTGTYVSKGPNDQKLWKGFLKAIPKIGDILSLFVREDKRPAWEKFIDYVTAISNALLPRDLRYVLLIDPDLAMKSAQATEWLTIASRIPPAIRVLIAQRPDDVIASHKETPRRFHFIPEEHGGQFLSDLDPSSIQEWYEAELLKGGRLTEVKTKRSWSQDIVRALPDEAYQRYCGHPIAHDAICRLLAINEISNPVKAIRQWPREVTELMNLLFESLCEQDSIRLGAAFLLPIFSVPTPQEVWCIAAGMSPDELMRALHDPHFRHFFKTNDDDMYALFHSLFNERVEQELGKKVGYIEILSDSAWKAIEPALDPEKLATSNPRDFELLAATPIAARFRDETRLIDTFFLVFEVKNRLGLLDAALGDIDLLRRRFPNNPKIQAVVYSSHGIVLSARGDLDGAMKMHNNALEIHKKLGILEGMATAYGNLGVILGKRSDLDGAEEMFNKTLAINEKLGRLEKMASSYSNLGLVRAARGDLDGAEEMYNKALTINEKIGAPVGMAAIYNNLGIMRRTRGDLDGAEEMYNRTLEINEKIGNLRGMASDYGNLGIVREKHGDLDEAEEMYKKALEINKRIDRLEGMAKQYGNLGNVRLKHGDLGGAEEMYKKALEICEKLGLLEETAAIYGNLGIVRFTRGDLDGAEKMYKKALAIDQNIGGLEGMANRYGNLGNVREKRGDLDGAEKMYNNALEICEKLGLLEEMANNYCNLGVVWEKRGDLDGAEEMYNKSQEINKQLGRKEGTANNYGNLGNVREKRGDLDGAEEMYNKALEICEKLGLLEQMAHQYSNLGNVRFTHGDLGGARDHWIKARDLFMQIGMPHMVEKTQGLLDGQPREHK